MSQPPAHIQQQPINSYCWDVTAYKQINNLLVSDHNHHHHQPGQNPNAHYLPQSGRMYLPPGVGMQLPQQQQQQQQLQHVSPQLYQLPGAGQVEGDMYPVQQQQQRQQQQPAPFQQIASQQAYCPQQVPYLQQVSSPRSVQLPHPIINNHLLQAPTISNARYHNHHNHHHHHLHQYSPQANGRAMDPAIYHQQNQYSEATQHHYKLMPSHHQQAHYCQQQQRQYQDNFYHQLGGFSSGQGELVAPLAPPSQTSHVDGGGGAEIDEFGAELHNHHPQHQSEAAIVNDLYYQDHMDLHPTIKQQQEERQKLAAMIQQPQNASQLLLKPLAHPPPIQSRQQQPQLHNSEQFQAQDHSHPGGQQQQASLMVAPLQPQQLSLLRITKSTDSASTSLDDAKQCQQAQYGRPQSSAAPAYQQPPPGQQLHDAKPTSSSDLGSANQTQAGDTCYQEQKQRQQLQESQVQGHQQQQDLVEMGTQGSLSQDWLDTICRHLIEHMSQFGICVIDNFLGSLKGELILKEVEQLYENGQHCSKGRVVSSKPGDLGTTNVIRNDWVIWIDGCEDGCAEINNLIQTLCSVITNSARLSLYSNNGLDKVVINKRTKAHVSCYPGNGTRYIKHVDNPNGDGRVITSIYYLNKNWFTKRDGGLLRMFPAGMDEVANIEPLFDRALFFWSDRRNPHEVLPAYRDRYAITVWYIGEERPQV